MECDMKYTIGLSDRQLAAKTKREALTKARIALRVKRIYKGAQYAHEDGGTGLDIWIDRKNAKREMGCCADCVITW